MNIAIRLKIFTFVNSGYFSLGDRDFSHVSRVYTNVPPMFTISFKVQSKTARHIDHVHCSAARHIDRLQTTDGYRQRAA